MQLHVLLSNFKYPNPEYVQDKKKTHLNLKNITDTTHSQLDQT